MTSTKYYKFLIPGFSDMGKIISECIEPNFTKLDNELHKTNEAVDGINENFWRYKYNVNPINDYDLLTESGLYSMLGTDDGYINSPTGAGCVVRVDTRGTFIMQEAYSYFEPSFIFRRGFEKGNKNTPWIRMYSTGFKPTKNDVGLGYLQNWTYGTDVTDDSTTKYARMSELNKAWLKAVEALSKANTAQNGVNAINRELDDTFDKIFIGQTNRVISDLKNSKPSSNAKSGFYRVDAITYNTENASAVIRIAHPSANFGISIVVPYSGDDIYLDKDGGAFQRIISENYLYKELVNLQREVSATETITLTNAISNNYKFINIMVGDTSTTELQIVKIKTSEAINKTFMFYGNSLANDTDERGIISINSNSQITYTVFASGSNQVKLQKIWQSNV